MAKVKEPTALEKIYRHFKERGIVTTQREFAEKLKYAPSPMSRLINGVKPIPFPLLKTLYNKYRININFVISGEGDMYIKESSDDEKSALRDKIAALEREMEVLRKSLSDKDKIITMLEEKKR